MADSRKDRPASQGVKQADEDFPISDAFFEQFFRYAAMGMMLCSADGRLIKVNQTLCDLIGYSADEVILHHFQEFTYPDDIEDNLNLMQQTVEGERRTYQMEKRYVHKNGSLVWVLLHVVLIQDNQGKALYLLSEVQDITARKLVEQKLEEHTLRYKSLLKHNPDIICLLDHKGKLISVNPAAEKITGYGGEELIGHCFLTYIQSEDSSTAWELFENCSAKGEIGSAEVGMANKPGSMLVLEVSFVPIIAGNLVGGIYLIAKDITKRKQHEATIVQLHNKNKLILNAVSDGIFGIDERLHTIFWNDAAEQLTGYTSKEMTFHNAYHILTRNDEADAAFLLQEAYSPHSNVTFYKKSGEPFPVEYITNLIYDQEKVIGTVITFKDITERQKTDEMLLKSEKLSIVGQIAAGVAHEIRNPLTALKGFIQFLQSGASNKQEYYEIMLSELSRIEMIITEMLVLAKPQSIRFQPKSLQIIMQSVIALLETQAILSNIQFVVVEERNLPLVMCEENQLKQMFINLIKNAMESMPQGGPIDIHMFGDEEGHVFIWIKDQGEGMLPEVLERIGEPFYSTKEKGTGLGLMISSKIIEDHKGSMSIESNPGEGTTVKLTLSALADLKLPEV